MTDPVTHYTATLTAALHGPPRVKSRLVAEIRDGLSDTVAAYTREGRPAEQAVRDFGTPAELVPACQRELTIAQARRTAGAIALTGPLLIACWYALWTVDGVLPRTALVLAVHLAGIAAVLSAVALAATGRLSRWLPTPRRFPLAVAWLGTTASVAMAVATLALAAAAIGALDWPLIALAVALGAAAHGTVASSARACRECARLAERPRIA
jgi:uncharacterized membrane protein